MKERPFARGTFMLAYYGEMVLDGQRMSVVAKAPRVRKGDENDKQTLLDHLEGLVCERGVRTN